MAKFILTPETCRHLDTFCNECLDRLVCEPLARELQEPVFGGRVEPEPLLVKSRRSLPEHLKGASPAVRKAHGY